MAKKNAAKIAATIIEVIDQQCEDLKPEDYADVLAAIDGHISGAVDCLREEHDEEWADDHLQGL